MSMHNPSPPNAVIKHILVDTLMRSKLLSSPDDLDALLNNAVPKIEKACQYQSRLLTEKEVSKRWEFLTLSKLRTMRTRKVGPVFLKFSKTRNGRIYYRFSEIERWIIKHEQLENFLSI